MIDNLSAQNTIILGTYTNSGKYNSGGISILDFDEGKIELIPEETLLSRKVRFKFRATDIHLSNNETFLYVTKKESIFLHEI